MPDIVMGQPLSRTEAILQNMLGANNVLEPPMSREEYLLLLLLNQVGPSGNYYTKEEVDNKISALEQEIDWKESVATFADLATTYPDAEAGWTASVLADGRIYRYNGTSWVDIYGMIPLATSSVNGLMSSGKVIDLETVKTLLNGHSVASDVPANAVFTDTVYDDTEIKASVADIDTALSVPDGSGKNKLKKTGKSSGTSLNVTFTPDTDGTISVNGTATGGIATYYLFGSSSTYESLDISPGNYLLNGSTQNSYLRVVRNRNEVTDVFTSSNNEDTLIDIAADDTFKVQIRVAEGTTVTNEIAKPMIRPVGTSPDFVPYIPSVNERLETVEGLLNNHTVNTDVPSDAEFTDTVYDDTEVKADITDLDNRVTDLENQETDVNVSKTVTGNPISITDAADAPIVSGEVTFEPIQDLHGYDKPWAGGAGKNKLPLVLADIKSANTDGTWSGNTYTVRGVAFTVQTDSDGNVVGIKVSGTAQANLYMTIGNITLTSGSYSFNGTPSSGGSNKFYMYAQETGAESIRDYGSGADFTIDGTSTKMVLLTVRSDVTVNDEVFYPMIRLATETDPTFEPYENICPITGYDDCEVEVMGKNKLVLTLAKLQSINTDGTWNNNVYTYNERVFTVLLDDANNVIGINISASGSGIIYFLLDNAFNSTDYAGYIINGFITDGSVNTFQYRISTQDSWAGFQTINDINGVAIVDNGNNLRLGIRISGSSYTTTVYPMIRLATETDPTFEPYQSTTYTIDLDGTRYGGKMDFNTGVMTVDRTIVDFDGSDVWRASQTTGRYIYAVADGKFGNEAYEYVKTSHYPYGTFSSPNAYWCDNASGVLRVIFNTSFATKADWLSYLATQNTDGTPLQICYPLATPFTVQLTPEQIRTLEGTNNISTNMTGMSLEYITQDYQPLVDLAEAERETYYESGGMFVDTSNVIVPLTAFTSELSYTATEDCFAFLYLVTYDANHSPEVRIDGQLVYTNYYGSTIVGNSCFLPLKKGQTLTVAGVNQTVESQYCVYGVTYINKIIQPVIYSEEEREIGVWTDGRPLYQKTIFYECSDTSDVQTAFTFSDNEIVQDKSAYFCNSNGDKIDVTWANVHFWDYVFINTEICVKRETQDQNWQTGVEFVCTIRYTKSTDTPGSGTWTPSGVPAVHYSTDEHVVGTWTDGSTLYQRTVDVSGSFSINNNEWTNIFQIENLGTLVSANSITDDGTTSDGRIRWNKSGDNVQASAITDVNFINPKVTVQYTKSTD